MQSATSGDQARMATDVAAEWGAALVVLSCSRCGEAHLVPEHSLRDAEGKALAVRCPWCLQGPVAAEPAHPGQEPPEQVVPYGVSQRRLAAILEQWSRGVWFRPDDLRAGVLTRRARRYLLPLWLVDARVEGAWRAEVGFDYQVVSYQDRYSEGVGWSSQQVEEKRVRWEPRVGRLNRTYANVVAPALDDHRALIARLGNFDLGQRMSYGPEAVDDAAVRIPSLEPSAAWPGAEAALTRAAEAECRQAAGADHIRGFVLQAEYGDRNWSLLLLPAYITWYREGGRVWPILINGQSGGVSGVRRASSRKANVLSLALGAVALLLFLAGGGLALLAGVLPLGSALGGVILVAGLLLAVTAPIPAMGAWVFNCRSVPDAQR